MSFVLGYIKIYERCFQYEKISDNLTDRTGLVRDSGIELLKIIAILLIVIFHVVQTLCSENFFIPQNDYVVDLSVATTDVRNFVLTLFSYFGAMGNLIFFVCSAWFLLRSSKYNKRKCFFMIFEVWFVSVTILVVTSIIRHGDISGKILIKSIMPTTFGSNWYLTCYLLFYPIHPILNSIINKMNRQQLFRASVSLFILYCCFGFIKKDLFFSSYIIVWVTIYFVMAYLQLYMDNFMKSSKKNLVLLVAGFAGYICVAILVNVLGLSLNNNVNPFLIAISISLFNLMRKLAFKNKAINYISSLSLLIYIIHENIILRTYYRPAMWDYIYQNFGYDKLLLWVFVLALLVFAFGFVSSVIYDKTIRRMLQKVCDNIYFAMRTFYLRVEAIMLKMH